MCGATTSRNTTRHGFSGYAFGQAPHYTLLDPAGNTAWHYGGVRPPGSAAHAPPAATRPVEQHFNRARVKERVECRGGGDPPSLVAFSHTWKEAS